ncbi:hypothetical protein [Bifidobacterium tissieri]|uniref:Uncharacterized protein n=1 Tax=Bifidobacterium tissieri TaxID=1630162 RepID=A0A5M9ZVR1_9BIFI|nr:hypothetical protein [Bifidobacterium tissieri]KAA8828662.1 hypothetical protein EM849_11535 [Bifidobacterium tissieri]KAA8831605.1 hypothetical protein EMO89_02450 [Bifidobacterium tissieri]
MSSIITIEARQLYTDEQYATDDAPYMGDELRNAYMQGATRRITTDELNAAAYALFLIDYQRQASANTDSALHMAPETVWNATPDYTHDTYKTVARTALEAARDIISRDPITREEEQETQE